MCQKALQSVQHCLYLPAESTAAGAGAENAGGDLLPEPIASKIVLVLLLVTEALRTPDKETKLSMVRAYVLALFSHFATKLLGDLYLGLHGPEALLELFQPKEDSEPELETKQEQVKEEEDVESGGRDSRLKKKKKKTSKLDRFKRKRRGGLGSCSSEDSEGGGGGSELERDSYDECK